MPSPIRLSVATTLTLSLLPACAVDPGDAAMRPSSSALTRSSPAPNFAFSTLESNGDETGAAAVNDRGTILAYDLHPAPSGACSEPSPRVGDEIVRFADGTTRRLFTPDGQTHCYPRTGPTPRINASDTILVDRDSGHPALWRADKVRLLAGELAPVAARCGFGNDSIFGLSDTGALVGQWGLCNVLYDGTAWRVVSTLAYEAGAYGVRINALGRTLLQEYGPYGSGGVELAEAGVATHRWLGAKTDPQPHGVTAVDLNGAGLALARGDDGTVFLHDGVASRVLSGPGTGIVPTALSDFGAVIGNGPCAPPATGTCALTRTADGWTELGALADTQGWQLLSANGINGLGEIVGDAIKAGVRRGYVLRPLAETPRFYVRATFDAGAASAMTWGGGAWTARIAIPLGGGRFRFDHLGDGTETYGDANGDGTADRGASDIALPVPGTYDVTFDPSSRAYAARRRDPFERTVVFVYGPTSPGQDMFLRGGIDHAYAKSAFGLDCTAANAACAIPIRHLNTKNATTAAWKTGDTLLDWYGAQPGQAAGAQGTPLDWTTSAWPSGWGPKRTVAVDGFGETPLNDGGMGPHYWMLDVEMDCSRTVHGWFEVKSFIANGAGWEPDVHQTETPYASNNHFVQCGRINVLRRGESGASVREFP